MTNVLFLYFSGTGNTHYVTEYLVQQIESRRYEREVKITVMALEWSDPSIIQNNDIICIGYPIYAMDPPEIVLEFINSLENVQDKGVFAYNTKGLAAGLSNKRVLKLMEEKGFRPLGETSITMPGSDGLSMMGKDSWFLKQYIDKDFNHMKKLDKFAKKIIKVINDCNADVPISGQPRKIPFPVYSYLYDWIIRISFHSLEKSIKKKFRVDENCTRCELCVKACPVENISISDSGITFGDKCILCIRCVNQCPAESVQIGNLTVNKFRWKGPKGNFKPLQRKKGPEIHDVTNVLHGGKP
jgi:ferredoxin/flavodoxin